MAVVAVWVALGANPATAQEDDGERERPWTNMADLSFVHTGGNSSITTLALSNEFTYRWTLSRVTVKASALKTRTTERNLDNLDGSVRVEERTRTTAEEYELQGRYRRTLYGPLFVFTGTGWSRNEFSGIDNRYTAALGLGYQIVETEQTRLSAQVGGDWTQEDPVTGASRDFVGVQILGEVEHKLTESATLQGTLEVQESLNDTEDLRVNALAGLTTSLSRVLAVKLSYLVRFDNQPVTVLVPSEDAGVTDAAFEFDKTDTRLGVSLVVNF